MKRSSGEFKIKYTWLLLNAAHAEGEKKLQADPLSPSPHPSLWFQSWDSSLVRVALALHHWPQGPLLHSYVTLHIPLYKDSPEILFLPITALSVVDNTFSHTHCLAL